MTSNIADVKRRITGGEAHSQRAASNSDYHLTGPITCPRCGHRYVGTSAHGKLRRYCYYTCLSHNRYGTAGCDGARIDADLIDQAIHEALIDFYAAPKSSSTPPSTPSWHAALKTATSGRRS